MKSTLLRLGELAEVRHQQELDALWKQCEEEGWGADNVARSEAVKRRWQLEGLRTAIVRLTDPDQSTHAVQIQS